MINPYVLLAALVMAIGVFGSGVATGVRWESGKQAISEQHIAQAVDAANRASAEAIANLKPVYTTIQSKLEKQIETHTVYRDCHLDPIGLQLLDTALAGGKPLGAGKLPTINPTGK